MKVNGMINVGLLIDRIIKGKWATLDDCSAELGVATSSIQTLLDNKGRLPRLDAFRRIVTGLNIDPKELIISCPHTSDREKIEATPFTLRTDVSPRA